MENEIEELKAELTALQALIAADKAQRLVHVRSKYDNAYQLLRSAISDARALQDSYGSLRRELDLSSIVAFIGDVNNPLDVKLGFSFIDAVQSAINKAFLEPLPDDEDGIEKKRRLTDVLDKVLNNPLTSILLRSNPVSGIISKVVDIASGFVETTLNGKPAKKLKAATKEIIGKEKIEVFVNQMAKYEELYSKMTEANDTLEKSNGYLKLSMEEQVGFSKDAYQRFLALLSISADKPFIDLDQLFGIKNKQSVEELEAILDNKKIQEAIKFVGNLEDAKIRLGTLRDKFTASVKEFKDDYLKVLQKPLEGDWDNVDLMQLRSTVERLQSFG